MRIFKAHRTSALPIPGNERPYRSYSTSAHDHGFALPRAGVAVPSLAGNDGRDEIDGKGGHKNDDVHVCLPGRSAAAYRFSSALQCGCPQVVRPVPDR
jgi:hypothetical protein